MSVKSLHFRQYHLTLDGKFLPFQFLQVLHLREACPVYARRLALFMPFRHFLFQQPPQEGETSPLFSHSVLEEQLDVLPECGQPQFPGACRNDVLFVHTL